MAHQNEATDGVGGNTLLYLTEVSCELKFAKFADGYGLKHEPSSPKFPQSNGKVERAVKTVKLLLRKSTASYLALMTYRSTPLEMATVHFNCCLAER